MLFHAIFSCFYGKFIIITVSLDFWISKLLFIEIKSQIAFFSYSFFWCEMRFIVKKNKQEVDALAMNDILEIPIMNYFFFIKMILQIS